MNTINKINENISINKQRENLLNLNPDLVYGVYELKKNSENEMILENREELLTCYPNQFENLNWINEISEIWILDLWVLRKWEIKFLNKDRKESYLWKKLVLVSNWVIEIVKWSYKQQDWEKKQRNHFPTTLRDWWAVDQNQRTSVAWRNTWSNLFEDLEREYAEESPFLGKKEDWNYYLFTPENENKDLVLNDLIESVKSFLKNKYNLDRNNSEHLDSIKLMERSLRIKYEDLWKILTEIIENKRIDFFKSKHLENFEWVSDDFREIKMLDSEWRELSKWKFFVYFDRENNTIEYRALKEIEIPKWVRPSSRLFLESQNQGVKNSRLENLAKDKLVPTIKYFVEKVLKTIKK